MWKNKGEHENKQRISVVKGLRLVLKKIHKGFALRLGHPGLKYRRIWQFLD